jgi:hypothetical protein
VSRGKGLHRSTPARIAHRLGGHTHPKIAAALAAGPRGSANLTTCQRLDQGNSSTCHAHSAAAAIWTSFNAAGKPLSFVPSPLVIASTTYADLRAKATAVPPFPKLTDDGAQLQDDADAIAMWGLAPVSAPTKDGRFSDVENYTDGAFPEPDTSTLQVAGESLADGEYQIAVDASAHNVVAASLDVGIAVWLGVFVDSAFEQLGPNDIAQPANASDPSGGGHALFLSGYRTAQDGSFEFLIVNSWGYGWANNGTVWASTRWLLSCWDLWPMSVVA